MAREGRPLEGSWTEHYPELGTGDISFADSTSKEHALPWRPVIDLSFHRLIYLFGREEHGRLHTGRAG